MKVLLLRPFLYITFIMTLLLLPTTAKAQCPTVTSPNQSFCDLESPVVSDLSAVNNGGGIVWYASATSTTPLSPTTGLNNNQVYYADSTNGTCGPRPSVTVQIYGAPTGLNFQGDCFEDPSQATISLLDAVGNNIQWYDVPSGGTPLDPNTVLIDGTIYYASQTNPDTGCETSRLSVFVNNGLNPVPTGDPIQEFCLSGSIPTVGNLDASGNNNWYLTSTSAVPLALSTPLVNGQSYFATTVDPPCESVTRLEVVAILIDPTAPGAGAGLDGQVILCQNDVGSTFNLFSELGGVPSTSGTWTGPLATMGGHLGTIDTSVLTSGDSPYIFTYTVPSVACGPSTATVTIEILPLPTATISANATICAGSDATVSFSGSPGATVVYTVNGGAQQSITLNGSGSATIQSSYNTTAIYELVSITSAGSTPCSQSLSGSVTITVLPLPVVTISSDVTICSGQNATVNFSGTPNATVSYSVNNGPTQTLILSSTGVASVTNSYTSTTTFTLQSISTTGTPSCSQPQDGTVTITVIPIPVVAISSNVNVCPGESATVTFTGTPNATVNYTVNGGGVQAITLNSSGSASITNTYTVTTTYTLTGIISGGTTACPAPASGAITITVLPLPVVSIAANTSICEGESATVTFTGTPGATVSYTVNGGSVQTIVLDSTGNATITDTYTSTAVFTLQSIASASTPSCSQVAVGSVTINVVQLPVVALSTNQSVCFGESASVTFTGTPNATVTFTVNGTTQTITLDASGSATYTNAYTATTEIVLVEATTSGTPGCSQPQSGSTTITVIPVPTVSISGSSTVCPGGSSTITFTGTPNATVSYTVNGGPVVTIVLDGTGSATVTSVFNTTTVYEIVGITTAGVVLCDQPVSGTVTITVAPLPVVTISQDTTICAGQNATVTFTGTPNATINYTVNGTNQTIVLNASGTATVSGSYTSITTFTLVSATAAGAPSCSQLQSGSVVITVLQLPVVAISANGPVCVGESATVTFTGTPHATVTYTVNGGVNQTIQLDASGSATITGTYPVSTTITLVSATLAGSPSCSAPLSGSVTITVVQLPTVSISGTAAICSGESATITFSGTPGATVTFTINGSSETITLDANGSATITNTYTATTEYVLTDITGTDAPGCAAPASGSVLISIVPPPTVTIGSDTSICIGQTATTTFTGTPGAIVSYTINGTPATIILNSAGTATITNNYSVTTIIELQSASLPAPSGCSQPQSGTATITVLQLPVATLSSNVSICIGSSATVTFTGTPGALVTYTVNGGTNQTLTLSGSGVATITGNFSTTTTYTIVSVELAGVSGCSQPQTSSTTITVLQPPIATIAISGSNTVCAGQSATINFSGTPNAVVTYTVNGGPQQTINLDNSGNATLSPTISSTSTYALVSATTSGTPICSQPQTGSVTVTATPVPAAGNDVANLVICGNAGLQDLFLLLGPDADAGGVWTPALSGGDGIFDPEVDPAGTYTYTVSATAPCPNDSATVTITIQTPPNAGSDAALSLCSNGDSQDLFPLLGSNAEVGGTWSPALSSGTSVFDPAIDPQGVYTYTIQGTDSCSDGTATVTVTITPGPEAGQDGTLTICADSSPQDLFNSLNGNPQLGGIWSPALVSGTGVFDPSVDNAGVYTYTFAGTQPCDNDTATVTVNVNPVPDAGVNGTAFFCTNYPPEDLLLSLGGSPQPGGTWSPALASGTGVFNPLLDAPGIYTYTVGGNLCSTSTATVMVTVTQSPNAGGIGATLLITTCLNIVSVDLFTGLNGTQGAGIWSDDDNTGALTNNIFNPSAVGAGTYHFTYTVGGGVSPCLFDTATVTVVVDSQPNAGTFTSAPAVCSTVGTFDLSTLLTGQQTNGTWTDGNGQPVTNPIDISQFAGGSYNFTYTVVNACGTDAEIVQLNVLQSPAFSNVNITVTSPVCIGSPAIVNFSGMADGSYIINYSLSGSNVNPSQTVLQTITGGIGTLTVSAALMPNIGPTTITFNSILNNANGCSANLNSVAVSFVVSPISSLTGATIAVADVCLGSAAIVVISNAGGLPNGNYQFNYTLPNTTPGTGSTGIVTINNGGGQFTIPGNVFTTTGSHTLTIDNIISLGGCSNFNVATSVTFNVLALPDTNGGLVTTGDACITTDNQVDIIGAVNLPDGTYTLEYTLSGAMTATVTVQVVFVAGAATFMVPGTELPTAGSVTLTITQITATTGLCGVSTITLNPVTFNVTNLGLPDIVDLGNQFCSADSPTIADLTANIIGTEPVTWYDAPQNGNPYSDTDLLTNGTTYYVAFTASGCSDTVRFGVTADLTVCTEILIPDGFSPNNDGINDEFVIRDLPILYPNFKLEIYNRYGTILYKGNRNTPNWNGTTTEGGVQIGNNVVPTGVYFYILEFNDGVQNPVQGRLYLSR
ncbi:MAG: gliding motility-associated C-terminal domain-containing protein [Flavobacterium sp.]|nr:gliding motility-associated C-terminal domain-containing protein [Flavobacterium sp.]